MEVNHQLIEKVLRGEASPDELNGHEQEIYLDRFTEELWKEPTPEEQADFRRFIATYAGD